MTASTFLRVLHRSCEPFLLMYLVGMFLHMQILHQYVYSKISEKYNFPYDYHKQTYCKASTLNASLQELQKKVQSTAASFQIGISLMNYIPSIVVCLYIGSWSDRVGRKPVLGLSVFGSCLEASIIVLTMYLDLPIWVIFFGAFANGIGGFFTGLIIGSVSIVADTTEKNKRPLRFGLVECVIFLGGMVSSFVSGIILDQVGFKTSYWIAWSFLISCFLYIIFVLEETLPKETRSLAIAKASGGCCSYPKHVYNVVRRSRPNRWKITLLLPGSFFMSVLQLSIGPLFTLYLLNRPLCFDSKNVGYFLGARFLITGVGAVTGLKCLLRWITEHKTAMIGFASHIGAMVLFAYATHVWMIYLSCVLGLLSGVITPIFRGILSKVVDDDEQGAIFSVSASFEMLFTLLGNVIFNAFYKFAVDPLDFPGSVFLLNAGIAIIPLGLVCAYGIKLGRTDQRGGTFAVLENEESEPDESGHQITSPVSEHQGYGSQESVEKYIS